MALKVVGGVGRPTARVVKMRLLAAVGAVCVRPSPSVSLCRVRAAVVVEGAPLIVHALYRLLFAVFRRKRACRRLRMLHLFTTLVHLWLRKYLTWCERPLLVISFVKCFSNNCYIRDLMFWYCETCLVFCVLTVLLEQHLELYKLSSCCSVRQRFSATAKASTSTVGWTPIFPVLRWANISECHDRSKCIFCTTTNSYNIFVI